MKIHELNLSNRYTVNQKFWIGAAIMGGAAIANGIINNGQSYSNQKKLAKQQFGYQQQLLAQQNQYQNDYMDKANQFNVDMWNKENAYNTPKAQTERLMEAGINPALAYSNGSVQNVSASSPQSDTPSAPSGNFSMPASSYQPVDIVSAISQGLQLDNTISQKKAIDASADKTREEARALQIDNDIKQKNADDYNNYWHNSWRTPYYQNQKIVDESQLIAGRNEREQRENYFDYGAYGDEGNGFKYVVKHGLELDNAQKQFEKDLREMKVSAAEKSEAFGVYQRVVDLYNVISQTSLNGATKKNMLAQAALNGIQQMLGSGEYNYLYGDDFIESISSKNTTALDVLKGVGKLIIKGAKHAVSGK